MVKSMTGYGKATAEYEGKKITVELRSVNSKQLDINFRLPSLYRDKEAELRAELMQVQRGKVEFVVTVDLPAKATMEATINETLFNSYFERLSAIGEKLDIPVHSAEIMQAILRMPDVLCTDRKELSEEESGLLVDCTKKALEHFMQFREVEGKVLMNDITSRIQSIEQLLTKVEPFEKGRIDTVRTRIANNLNEVLPAAAIDKNRFEQELIFFLEKMDITEEKTRLRQHCKYFLQTAANEDAPGRKLSFISQEIGREINTLGSKANEVNMQQLVVQMKDELEKVKEQLLNIL